MCKCMCAQTHVCVCALAGLGDLRPPGSSPSPLPSPEVASGAAAQEATRGVGAAVATGAAPDGAFVYILAAPQGLVKVKARGADAAEAAQRVAAGGTAAGCRRLRTLVFVCEWGEQKSENVAAGGAALAPPEPLPATLLVPTLLTPAPLSEPWVSVPLHPALHQPWD